MKKTIAILWVLFITVAVGYYYDGYDTTGTKSALNLNKIRGDTITESDFGAIDLCCYRQRYPH
jgi:hypothetical protein